jgi:cytochrome c oxidase subunit 2
MSKRYLRAKGLILWRFLLALLALTATGCVSGVRSTLDALGPVAARQTSTFMVTLWVSLGMFAVVGSFLVYCLVKFHHKGEVVRGQSLPDQGHGSAAVEIGLILISVFLVGIIALPTVQGVFYVGTVPQGEKVYEVNVTGIQWWWKFEYPEYGVVTANEIAIPAGRPVKFNLRAQDVLHSFWVPRLGGKMDLNPGQENFLWLEADPELLAANTDDELHTSHNQPGQRWEHLPDDYPFQGYILYGQCAEYCGASHAFMQLRVLVLDDENFQKWIAWQKSDAKSTLPDEQRVAGENMFRANRCGTCHTIRGVRGAAGQVGPDLTHVGSRTSIAAGWLENTPDNMGHWIQNPGAIKPENIMWVTGYQHTDKWGEVQLPEPAGVVIDDNEKKILADYLYSLK